MSAKRRWSKIVAKHLNVLLVVTFLVYFYRDLFPLTTYNRKPLDISDGWVLWAKLIMLTLISVVIPLVIPRQYTPVDLKVSPNMLQG